MISKIATSTILLTGLTQAAKCPFGYGSPDQKENV